MVAGSTTREREFELIDELMTLDMGIGPLRKQFAIQRRKDDKSSPLAVIPNLATVAHRPLTLVFCPDNPTPEATQLKRRMKIFYDPRMSCPSGGYSPSARNRKKSLKI